LHSQNDKLKKVKKYRKKNQVLLDTYMPTK